MDSAEGANDTPTDFLVGCGGGHPLPNTHPFGAFGISISAPSAAHISEPLRNFFCILPRNIQHLVRHAETRNWVCD